MNAQLLIIPVIAFCIITYLSVVKNGKLTCDNYTTNTYLYTITYLFLMNYFVALLMQHPKFLEQFDLTKMIIALIIQLSTLLAIIYVPGEYVLFKHLLSIFYISVASLLLCLLFMYFDSKSIKFAVISSIILFIILSVIAWKYQHILSSSVSIPFIIALFILLIAELIIGLIYPSSLLEKFVITAVLMLICYLVLVKTKKMIENSEHCETPDYVKESIGFIVSFENILLRVLSLIGKKRLGMR